MKRRSAFVLLSAATLGAGGSELRLIDAVKAGNREAVRALLSRPRPPRS